MFLYDKKNGSIDVYKLSSNCDQLKQYRIEQMANIPENERVLIAETYSENWRSIVPLFEYYISKLDTTIIPIDLANKVYENGRYHFLENGKTSKKNVEVLLDVYYNGFLNECKIARIQDLNKIRYLLLRFKNYDDSFYDNRIKIMKDIIELPESLYLLQLIEQGKFSLIGDSDVSEQLSLFSIENINEFSLKELAIMDECGVTKNAYEKVLKKAKNDVHILKLVKNKI